MKAPRIFLPLRHRDFRLLWSGQTLTLLGSFVSQVAYPFQILQLGGSAIELGALASIFTAASLVFLLLGGAIADRVPRRTLIIVTELGSGVITAVVSLLGYSGTLQIWHLYVAVALFGAAVSFSAPAIGAMIPELVPEEILVPGNAVRGLSRQASRTGGPVIGGLLVATAGPPAAFAFDALTFFVSAVAVWLIRARPIVAPKAATSILAEIREGLAFVFATQWLWVTIFGWSLINAGFIGAFVVGLPLLVTDVLRAGAVTFGFITAAMGAGEALGAAIIGQLRIRRAGVAIYLFGAGGGAGLLIFGLVPTLPGALVAGLLIGFSFVCLGVLWESALQRHVPRQMLGRVTSVDWFGGTLLGPIAPIAAALITDAYGPPTLFIVAGCIATALSLLGLVLPSIRRLE
ncbi:MAG TPA: MFS transporter [Candidatus Limnocylindria bacterium]|nr:MFS transporter [Candidatus Limnocylindria bacterium]